MEDRLRPSRGSVWGLSALLGLLGVTAAWWALALWPSGASAPRWVAATRNVCFGAAPGGLPDAAGWAALLGQPAVMLGILLFGWGREIAEGLRFLWRRAAGRIFVLLAAASVAAGLAGAALRVASAAVVPPGSGEPARGVASGAAAGIGISPASDGAGELPPELPPETYPRLDRAPPALDLVDQEGRRVRMEDLQGRPTLMTFAYAHCETVCPAVVADVLAARRLLAAAGIRSAAVVVTLDPWRDTPARLPHIAEKWAMASGERVLSGGVEAVEAVLDAWEVPRSRDPANGQITHPRLVYVLDPGGRIAYAANGAPETLAALVRRTVGP